MKVVQTGLILALGASPAKAFVSQNRSPSFTRHGDSSALASSAQRDYQETLSGYTGQAAPSSPMRKPQQQARPSMSNSPSPDMAVARPITVQGGSLKTWALQSSAIERVEINLSTEGRPFDADIDLWHGPDNTPNKMRVYVEDGSVRPFRAVVETPRGPNTVAVRNIGQLEFPMQAQVMPNPNQNAVTAPASEGRIIQGGALKTYAFEPDVSSVQVLLRTDGRPLNARIELLQGPNNIKQVMELYIEDGMDRPFYAVIQTPGSGNVVRVVNTSSMEFPITASVDAHEFGGYDENMGIVVGGDSSSNFGPRDMQW